MYVTCLSLICPVGYRPCSAAAALRAGLAGFASLDYIDRAGAPLVGATVPALPVGLRGRERIAGLIRMAFDALDATAVAQLSHAPYPVIFCSRETGRPGAGLGGLMSNLQLPNGARLVHGDRVHVAAGSSGVVQALALARAQLSEPLTAACLVVAVDSLIDVRVLSWLDRTDRLKTSIRSDGVIPGEAACLLWVSRDPPAYGGIVPLGLGVGTETATVLNEEPFRADGMTAALRAALAEAGLGHHDINFRLSDAAGESYAFEELVLAQTRLLRTVRPSQPLWLPADCVGDCGAAGGFVQLAWAEQAWARGYAPGPVAALHAGGAFDGRAVAVLADPRAST